MENNTPKGEGVAVTEKEPLAPTNEFARRILIGATKREALNPKAPLTPVTKESLGTLSERDYTLFNTRSNEERSEHGAQMETWLTNTQALFTNSKEFFTTTEKGKQWAEVYKRLGLSVENIDKDALQQFYKKYLSNTDVTNGGIKQFVKDVLNAPEYKNAEGKLDTAKLQKDLPTISWIAHVFGENSAQVISRLTAAEGMLEENPDELITNTDTALPAHEKKILEFLHKEKVVEPKKDETRAETIKAEEVYKKYFGDNWKEKLKKTLLIDVKQATEEDRERERKNGAIGIVATTAEVGSDNELLANHIIIYNESAANDFAIRSEIGESLWNVLENTAITKKLPSAEALTARIPDAPEKFIEISSQLLDRWNKEYTARPTRYSGLTGKPREYKKIPEWKSEGFADGIAIEIKRKASMPLDTEEQQIWDSFTPPCKALLEGAALFLPEISKTAPSVKPETKPPTDTPKATDTPSHTEEDKHHEPKTHEIDPSKDLLSQVNEALRTEAASNIRFATTEAALKKYLKSMSIQNNQLSESDAMIKKEASGNKLLLSGKVNLGWKGSVTFTATLANNPGGGISVETHTLDLEGLAKTRRGDIEKNINNLDKVITEQINAQIDQSWEVSNMKIGEDKLGMAFKKK